MSEIIFIVTTGGIISNYVNRQLIVIVSLLGMAFSMYMTPHCSTKIIYFIVGGVLGLSSGVYDSSQMIWIIEIWQHKAGPFIQAQHFFYAVGSVAPTLIIAPFLDNTSNTSSSTHVVAEVSRMYVPFSILGAFNSLALAFQMFLFIFYRYHTPPMYANENFEQIDDAKNIPAQMEDDLAGNVSINQQNKANIMGMSHRKLKLIAATVLFLGAYGGMEVSTFQFIPTFGQYSNLKMSESASAYVLTGLLAMFAIGRAIGTIFIFKVRPELILLTNFIFIIIANLILLTCATSNLTMFWIGSILLGLGYSTMFPSFCAFMEKYLVFTSGITSLIVVFAATTAAIYPVIIGKKIEQNAVILTYTNFTSMLICAVAMFGSYKMTRKSEHRER